VPGLSRHRQRLPARRQDPYVITGLQQLAAQLSGRADHVLAVVQHRQQLPAAQYPRQPIRRRHPRLLPHLHPSGGHIHRGPLHPRAITATSEPSTDQPEQPGTEGASTDNIQEETQKRTICAKLTSEQIRPFRGALFELLLAEVPRAVCDACRPARWLHGARMGCLVQGGVALSRSDSRCRERVFALDLHQFVTWTCPVSRSRVRPLTVCRLQRAARFGTSSTTAPA
jgi:hypothetical protein